MEGLCWLASCSPFVFCVEISLVLGLVAAHLSSADLDSCQEASVVDLSNPDIVVLLRDMCCRHVKY